MPMADSTEISRQQRPLVVAFNCLADCEDQVKALEDIARVEHVKLADVENGILEAADVVILRTLAYLPRPAQHKLHRGQLLLCIGAGDPAVEGAAAEDLDLRLQHVDVSGAAEAADTALAFILGLLRKTHALSAQGCAAPNWLGSAHLVCRGMRRVRGLVLGLLGVNETGREVAIRVAAFGMSVIYFESPYMLPEDMLGATLPWIHKASSLEELLAASDVISLHCSLTPDTMHIINEDTLKNVKQGAMLVNVSSSHLIHDSAVKLALCSGLLGGCALDGMEGPPWMEAWVREHPNVLLTARSARQSEEAWAELRDLALQAARQHILLMQCSQENELHTDAQGGASRGHFTEPLELIQEAELNTSFSLLSCEGGGGGADEQKGSDLSHEQLRSMEEVAISDEAILSSEKKGEQGSQFGGTNHGPVKPLVRFASIGVELAMEAANGFELYAINELRVNEGEAEMGGGGRPREREKERERESSAPRESVGKNNKSWAHSAPLLQQVALGHSIQSNLEMESDMEIHMRMMASRNPPKGVVVEGVEEELSAEALREKFWETVALGRGLKHLEDTVERSSSLSDTSLSSDDASFFSYAVNDETGSGPQSPSLRETEHANVDGEEGSSGQRSRREAAGKTQRDKRKVDAGRGQSEAMEESASWEERRKFGAGEDMVRREEEGEAREERDKKEEREPEDVSLKAKSLSSAEPNGPVDDPEHGADVNDILHMQSWPWGLLHHNMASETNYSLRLSHRRDGLIAHSDSVARPSSSSRQMSPESPFFGSSSKGVQSNGTSSSSSNPRSVVDSAKKPSKFRRAKSLSGIISGVLSMGRPKIGPRMPSKGLLEGSFPFRPEELQCLREGRVVNLRPLVGRGYFVAESRPNSNHWALGLSSDILPTHQAAKFVFKRDQDKFGFSSLAAEGRLLQANHKAELIFVNSSFEVQEMWVADCKHGVPRLVNAKFRGVHLEVLVQAAPVSKE